MLKACSLPISTLLRLKKKKYQMRRESQCKKKCSSTWCKSRYWSLYPRISRGGLFTTEENMQKVSMHLKVTKPFRFKGLDLIDRVPDELWTEFHDIVQEIGIKTIPMEKKCKKANWLSEEALQIAVKRGEMKSKGEKGKYSHLNAEFQRIARRGKKAFLGDQC